VQAQRLQVQTLKWLASQLCPEIYGDSVAQEVPSETAHGIGPLGSIRIDPTRP